MQEKLLQDGPQRTYAVIFESGDEFLSGMQEFAKRHQLDASHFTGVGAFSDVTLGYFQRDRKQYKDQTFTEQFEVLSLVGDITLKGKDQQIHPHVVLGRADFTCLGGHIKEAHVWPTLEVIVTEEPGYLQRHHDPDSGLALISLGEAPAR